MKEPKNALIKQYQTMLKMDGVSLEFEEETLDAIAKTNSKNRYKLRAIIEEIMLDIMYHVPNEKTYQSVLLLKRVEHRTNANLLSKSKLA